MLEVRTIPSGGSSLMRMATAATEAVPRLVPTSHTGTGACCRR